MIQPLALPPSCLFSTTTCLLMPRRACRYARNPVSWEAASVMIVWTMVSVSLVLFYYVDEELVATQRELRSLITDNTPISGFYGPGSWWAWLITLGMTHAHSLLVASGPAEWDYDLIAASGYIIAAAIDLTLKVRAIGRLREDARESPLLPALLCAERVVSVGTGSSLFTIATASFVGGSSAPRRVGIAIITIVFAVVASCFTFQTYQAIFRAEGELADGRMLRSLRSFVLVNVPETIMIPINLSTELYIPLYLLVAGATATCIALAAIRGGEPWWSSVALVCVALAVEVVLPLVIAAGWLVGMMSQWLAYWVILWIPLYILAFFPQMGSFPITGLSITDMDQLATLLSIGFIAALRRGRHLWKALRNRTALSSSAHELQEFLPSEP
ncbi:hypothetical protein MSAN_01198800 [Mycena sanguinolenta]|uniref:Uncharacterized protein n=1 Tax=Mycena sanguinolenta TaxID=230812 RepID=A0A8H7D417_9AGAR|nr:hypothetical protein MSAN_01198800 [Mycena sanguinolenta]